MAWNAGEHLLAGILDALRVANWQRAGRRGAPRPQHVPRPGQQPRRTGHTGTRSTAQVKAYLDRFKPPREVSHA